MAETINMDTMVEFVAAWTERERIMAEGDAALATQEAQKVENVATLEAQASQIEAYRVHIDELRAELSVLRGELITEDHTLTMPFTSASSIRWAVSDTLKYVGGQLEGWANLRDRDFDRDRTRIKLLQWSEQLLQRYAQMAGIVRGGG